MREIARQLFNELGNRSISYNAIGNPLSYDGWSYTWEGRRLMGMSRSGGGNSGSYGSLSLNAGAMTLSHTQGTQDAGDAFSVDQAGNLTVSTDKAPGSYFLAEGVLKAEEVGGSAQAVSYQYNASGLRVSKTVDGVTTQYTLHGKLITHLKKGTDELHFFYDAQGKPAMVEFNGSYYAYVHTLQGDIAAIVDNTGTKVVEYGYDGWGKPTKAWSLAHPSESTLTSAYGKLAQLNPFRYRGYVWDEETGLYSLGSRYYDPAWGRFLNADAAIRSNKLMEVNVFGYCENNPVNHADIDGNYSKRLPTLNDGYKAPKRGPIFDKERQGYIDKYGNVWKWDPTGDGGPHWDVSSTTHKGGYINVYPGGKIRWGEGRIKGFKRDFFASLDPNTLHDHVIPPIEPQPGPSPYINPYPTPDPSRKNIIIDMRPETALPIPAPTQPGIPGQGINWNLTIDSVPGTGSLLPKNIVSAIIVLLAGSLALA